MLACVRFKHRFSKYGWRVWGSSVDTTPNPSSSKGPGCHIKSIKSKMLLYAFVSLRETAEVKETEGFYSVSLLEISWALIAGICGRPPVFKGNETEGAENPSQTLVSWGTHWTKQVQDANTKKYTTLLKEIQEESVSLDIRPTVMRWKTTWWRRCYCQDGSAGSIQSLLSVFSCRNRLADSTMHIGIKDLEESKWSKKKNAVGGTHFPGFRM